MRFSVGYHDYLVVLVNGLHVLAWNRSSDRSKEQKLLAVPKLLLKEVNIYSRKTSIAIFFGTQTSACVYTTMLFILLKMNTKRARDQLLLTDGCVYHPIIFSHYLWSDHILFMNFGDGKQLLARFGCSFRREFLLETLFALLLLFGKRH